MIRRIIAAALLFVAFVSMPFVGPACSKQGATQKLEPIRAAYVPAGYYLPFLIVESDGLLESRGYKFELTRYNDNVHMVNLFVNGGLDVAGQSALTMFPIEEEHPGLLKFVYGQYNHSYHFVVPEDSQIRDLVDLRGKTIGTWSSATATVCIRLILQRAGLRNTPEQRDYEIRTYGATELAAAMENGAVDALFGFDVVNARLLASGKYRLLTPEAIDQLLPNSPLFNGGAFIRARMVTDEPKKAVAIHDALLEAIEIINSEPIRAREILARALKVNAEIAAKARLDDFRSIDDAMLASARETQKLLLDSGFLHRSFDVSSLFWTPEKPGGGAP